MKYLIFALVTLASATAYAAHGPVGPNPPPTGLPTSYDCHVMIIAADLSNGGADADYSAPVDAGSHGGDIHTFNFQTHKLEVTSDGKWLALTWTRNGKVVASATTVRSEPTQVSAVLIAFDPNNTDEQVSVNCSGKF